MVLSYQSWMTDQFDQSRCPCYTEEKAAAFTFRTCCNGEDVERSARYDRNLNLFSISDPARESSRSAKRRFTLPLKNCESVSFMNGGGVGKVTLFKD